MFGRPIDELMAPDPVWTVPAGYAERAEYAKACIAAMEGIPNPLELRAAVEALRDATNQADVFAAHKNLIALLPKEPSDV